MNKTYIDYIFEPFLGSPPEENPTKPEHLPSPASSPPDDASWDDMPEQAEEEMQPWIAPSSAAAVYFLPGDKLEWVLSDPRYSVRLEFYDVNHDLVQIEITSMSFLFGGHILLRGGLTSNEYGVMHVINMMQTLFIVKKELQAF